MANVTVAIDAGFIDHILDPLGLAYPDEAVYLFVNSETNMRIGVPESSLNDFNVNDTRDHGNYMHIGQFEQKYQQLVNAGIKVL